MSPDDYCRDKVIRGSSLYYSLLWLNPARRRALIALHAFHREIVQIVDECQEVSVARAKLGWWREEIERLWTSQAQHPVSRALAEHIATLPAAREPIRDMLDGVAMDVDFDAYPSFTELHLYCRRLGGAPALLAAELLGYQDRGTARCAHELGVGLCLVSLLRHVGHAARRGRFYVPEDELKRFRVSHGELSGSPSAAVRELLKMQAQRARDHLSRALAEWPPRDRHAQHGFFVLAELARVLLDEIEADGFSITTNRVSLTPLRKLWIAWRTHRRERARHRRHAVVVQP